MEGALRSAREDVEQVLELRFPGAVPAEVIEAIRQETELPLVKQIHGFAVTAKSPDEFRAFLQQVSK